MRLFLFVVVAAVVGSACAMLPPPGKLAMTDVQFAVRDFKLPNGMRVVVEEDHGSGKAAVMAIVGAGASSDPAGKEGLAHFVEHLAFRARPDGKLTAAQMYDFAGASLNNAATSLDDTTYWAMGPKESLPALITILGAQLVDPAAGLPKETLEVERAVVMNELRFKTETGVVGQRITWLHQTAFPPGHKYARPVVGTPESIQALGLADVQKFVAQHYRPENITLQIIGDIDPAQVQALLDALPPALTEGPKAAKPAFTGRVAAVVAEPPESPPGKLVMKRALGIEDPELDIVWTLPSSWNAQGAVQSFVASAIETAVASGTWDDDEITFTHAQLVPAADATLLHVRVGLRHGVDPEKSLERVLDQLMGVWTRPSVLFITANRLHAVMTAALGATDLVTRGLSRAESTHYLGDPASYARRMGEVARVDHAQVISFAEKYVTRSRARALYLEPVPEAARPAVVATGVGTRLASDPTPNVQYPKEEVLKLARQPALGGATRFTLANGLQVLILPRGNMPVVSLALVLEGGQDDAEPLGAEAADWLASPSDTLHGLAMNFGIQRSSLSGGHAHVLTSHVANGNLANALAILSDRVGSMRVITNSVPIFRDRTIPWLAEREQRPAAVLERKIQAALYPQHRFGQAATTADIKEVSAGTFNDWLDAVYQPAGAKLVIVGDIDARTAEQLVRTWLGGWNGSATRPVHPAPPLPKEATVVLGSRPGATQTELTLTCRLPDAVGPTRVANQLLASLLELRLEEVLRQKLGATYGVQAKATGGAGGTAVLTLSTAIGAEDQTRALEFLRKTWTGLGADGWDVAEIDRARWGLARQASLWGQTNISLAWHLAWAWANGTDPAELEKFPDTLVGLGDVEVEQSWKACSATTVLGVLGDPGVAAPLKASGWLK